MTNTAINASEDRATGGRKPARKKKSASGSPGGQTTKTEQVLSLLRRPKGASIADLSKATGWQAHSVRGFLSGTLKKKMGLAVVSEKDAKGVRRYRIAKDAAA